MRATPKSATLMTPSRLTIRLAGLTSRWITPWPWEYPRADSTCTMISQTLSGSPRKSSAWRKAVSGRPNTHSITR